MHTFRFSGCDDPLSDEGERVGGWCCGLRLWVGWGGLPRAPSRAFFGAYLKLVAPIAFRSAELVREVNEFASAGRRRL